jgi:hypothetical protein
VDQGEKVKDNATMKQLIFGREATMALTFGAVAYASGSFFAAAVAAWLVLMIGEGK